MSLGRGWGRADQFKERHMFCIKMLRHQCVSCSGLCQWSLPGSIFDMRTQDEKSSGLYPHTKDWKVNLLQVFFVGQGDTAKVILILSICGPLRISWTLGSYVRHGARMNKSLRLRAEGPTEWRGVTEQHGVRPTRQSLYFRHD